MLNKLIEGSKDVFEYEDIIATIYEEYTPGMLSDINEQMETLPNIVDLLGGNPIEMMRNNHENHVDFMRNVIKYRQLDLLVQTLPWVYKAYASQGVQHDYFLKELNIWCDVIKKHIPQDYQKPLLDIYGKMIDWHEDIIDLSASYDFIANAPQQLWTDEHEQILSKLLKGDFHGLIQCSRAKLEGDLSLIDFYLSYIQPAMYKIGQLWEQGYISVAHEHLATSTISRVMASIYPEFVIGEVDKGIAIVSAVANEYHQIGARMIADVLEKDGWDVRYLGADIPSEDLITLINEVEPTFVCLSLTMSLHIDDMVNTVNRIKNEVTHFPLKIMVGGLAINTDLALHHLISADAFPKNARDSLETANRWWMDK